MDEGNLRIMGCQDDVKTIKTTSTGGASECGTAECVICLTWFLVARVLGDRIEAFGCPDGRCHDSRFVKFS